MAQDKLANVTDQTTPLNNIDSARFIFVDSITLEGPEQSGAGPVKNTFSLSDSNISSESTSNGTSYSVAYSHGFQLTGGFSLGITGTNSFTFSQTQTAGTSNGTSHTGTVTLGTSDVGCFESVNVYEDTTYHTFAYALPQAPPASCQ